jgi:hypothetical protein
MTIKNFALALVLFMFAAFGVDLAFANDHPAPPTTTTAAPQPHPFWLTPDNDGGRDAHIGISALIGTGVTLALPNTHWLGRTAICMIPGIGKELKDWRSGSGVSRADLRADALGCLGGVAIGGGLIYLSRQSPTRPVLLTWQRPL